MPVHVTPGLFTAKQLHKPSGQVDDWVLIAPSERQVSAWRSAAGGLSMLIYLLWSTGSLRACYFVPPVLSMCAPNIQCTAQIQDG